LPRLTLDDIADLRAYERDREEFRRRVIELKRDRRVAVGPVISLVFENSDTIRFQIQEMARAERILTDAGIQTELDIYNPLIPEPGELSATLFVELTSEDEMREWLPKLVGIERAVRLRLGRDGAQVAAEPEASHEALLTRDEITASVHYVRFHLDPDQVERFVAGPVELAVDHPSYHFSTPLSAAARASLAVDLLSGG
jgi:hypothetical protein